MTRPPDEAPSRMATFINLRISLQEVLRPCPRSRRPLRRKRPNEFPHYQSHHCLMLTCLCILCTLQCICSLSRNTLSRNPLEHPQLAGSRYTFVELVFLYMVIVLYDLNFGSFKVLSDINESLHSLLFITIHPLLIIS